jgi:protein-tyrosine phosphatase
MSIFRRHRPVDASEVMPGLLVGSAPNASQCAELYRRGVRSVVDLRAEVENEGHWRSDVIVRRMSIRDRRACEPAELAELARWVVKAIDADGIVLVHCHAGMGRAATVGCAVLMELGYSLGDAYRILRSARPIVAPTDAQMAVLQLLSGLRFTDPMLASASAHW